ncbi:MAG: LptF/LptG family permease [Bacteroidota bacterium]
MLKKIDKLLLTSFVGPFAVTFGIALFALLMQIMWVYIDDIAGKGLGMLVVLELLSYKCVGLVPMALPLALLISGVMVLGGLGERYELASMKSAGISLIRVMRPLIIFGICASVLSYLCNDYIIPAANLQFGSRMYDIREKKPALSLEAGVFNDDFGDYAIRIGEKEADGRTIKDILIYDHTNANSGRLSHVIAESGEMFSTDNGRYLVMQLYNGHQYVETGAGGRSSNNATNPFIRTAFKSWNKVFDLSEFNMDITAKERFDGNRSMMTTSELDAQVDSIQKRIDRRYTDLGRQVGARFSIMPIDSFYPITYQPATSEKEEILESAKKPADTLTVQLSMDSIQVDTPETQAAKRPITSKKKIKPNPTTNSKKRKEEAARRAARIAASQARRDSVEKVKIRPIQRYTDSLTTVNDWLSSLNTAERRRMLSKAKSSARSIVGQAEQADITLNRTKEDKVKHIYDLHMKYSMAMVCIIFVFVGAPLGAIVRKGGFGYPLLISVIAFVLFIVLTIFCRKIAETFIVTGTVAAWLPCIILAPIGLWLTNKARKDERLFGG